MTTGAPSIGDSGEDGQPTPPAAPMDAPGAVPRWRRIGGILLAPVAATLAVGIHFAINVPRGGAQVSARDQGVAKAGEKKKKPAKKPPRKKGFEARPAGEVEATWLKYENVDFEAEPVKSAWARPHQSLVNQVVTTARGAAFEGAPEEPRVSVGDVACRTIRCRFVLRGPFAHEVQLLSDTLAKLELGGSTIWRHYSTTKVAPGKPDQPASDTYLQVTIAFVADNLDSEDIAVPDAAGGKPKAADGPSDGKSDDDDENDGGATPDDDDEQNGNEQADDGG
jgi:hypothetical protein